MSVFRTSSLFRFCKERIMLQNYLKTGIYPNYCEEDLSCEKSNLKIGIPMASFCDIPITLLSEHHERYGEYGIGLTKEWAIKNGISPVMYITNEYTLRGLNALLKTEQEHLAYINSDEFKRQVNLKAIPEPIGHIMKLVELMKHEKECFLNRYLLGFCKKYKSKFENKTICNYTENEWRYIVSESKEIPWYWSHEDYVKWRSPEGIESCPKPAPAQKMIEKKLTFEASDVTYIIVKEESQVRFIIKTINELKYLGGSKIRLHQHDKDLLCSKIISRERINKDF